MNTEKPITAMTDEEIQTAINVYYEEQQRRKRIRREALIHEFEIAFAKLRDEGIVPQYHDPYCFTFEEEEE